MASRQQQGRSRSKPGKQYTIRNVPAPVDRELRRLARKSGRSINDLAVEALTRGTGLAGEPILHHDLDWLGGTWIEDPAFDEALEAQHQVDKETWK